MGSLPRDSFAEAMLRLEARESRYHILHHSLVASRRDLASAMTLGEIDNADRQ
jgi:hypothetical protein